ncbi:hypothetical protein ACLKA7_007702, partial [Drosophila subpalustris]
VSWIRKRDLHILYQLAAPPTPPISVF